MRKGANWQANGSADRFSPSDPAPWAMCDDGKERVKEIASATRCDPSRPRGRSSDGRKNAAIEQGTKWREAALEEVEQPAEREREREERE